MQSLAHAFKSSAKQYPNRIALISGNDRLDYHALDRQSDAFASTLAKMGVSTGERIGLYCMNSPFFVIAYLGIIKAGATVVPINLLINTNEMAFILTDAGAKGLVHHAVFAEQAEQLKTSVASLAFTLSMGGD